MKSIAFDIATEQAGFVTFHLVVFNVVGEWPAFCAAARTQW